MEKGLLNNEVKSDVYKEPIGLLIRLYKPKTIEELKEVLNNNGYFGRFRINKLDSNKKTHVIISIDLYLKDSKYWYTWPFKNSYNLSLGLMVKAKKVKYIYATKLIMNSMVDKQEWRKRMENNSLSQIGRVFAELYGSCAYKFYDDIFKMIIDAGLIRINDNKKIDFAIESKKDAIEVYHNLFDASMNPD